MSINIKPKVTFNNTYEVTLIDSKTNEVKQQGIHHNVTLTRTGTFIASALAGNNSTFKTVIGKSLYIGSGTTTPTAADTSLTNGLWTFDVDNSLPNTCSWIDDSTLQWVCGYTVPATSAYVATVTEVGVTLYTSKPYQSTTALVTHALLTDSQGQPISYNKTDTDILRIVVTLRATLSIGTTGWQAFKKPRFLRAISKSTNGNSINDESLGAFTMHYTKNNKLTEDVMANTSTILCGGHPLTQSRKTSSGNVVNHNVVRLGTSHSSNNNYYAAICLTGVGYIALPNEALFPTYNITGVTVGTGDGTVTDFELPFDYFKVSTDAIYIDGVAKVRGTDYTITNIQNKNCYPAIAEMIATPTRIYSNSSVRYYTGYRMGVPIDTYVNNLNKPTVVYAYSGGVNGATNNLAFAFDYQNPLYIEYENAVELNTLCARALSYVNSSGNISVTAQTFYVDYSVDGDTYTNIGEVNLATSEKGNKTFTFENTTAKYWRIRVNSPSSPATYANSVLGDNGQLFLTRRQTYGLHFNTAPAAGASITMDCGMDIIYKNDKFVIDTSGTVTYALT